MEQKQNEISFDIDPDLVIDKIADKLGNDVFENLFDEIKSIDPKKTLEFFQRSLLLFKQP